MPQLDGLRALAVTAVMLQHYNILSTGAAYGVHLFFVLSGFLITGILMRSRRAIETSGLTLMSALRQFYIRRALRIFPLYYAVLFVGIAANAEYAREYAPWLLTYTINLKMAAQGWYIGNFAHFWSLAVEEQYYLVWPCLILLVPRKRLIPAAVILTAIGPLFRLFLAIAWRHFASEASPLNTYIATPTALDSLGIGSLISIVLSLRPTRSGYRGSIVIAAVVSAILILGAAMDSAWWILADTATAIFFGWLIYRASAGFKGLIGNVLSFAPLVSMGRISYGIYVFHPLVPAALLVAAKATGLTLPPGPLGTAVSIVITLLVSIASWYAFESPINKLKTRFAPAGSGATASPAAA